MKDKTCPCANQAPCYEDVCGSTVIVSSIWNLLMEGITTFVTFYELPKD